MDTNNTTNNPAPTPAPVTPTERPSVTPENKSSIGGIIGTIIIIALIILGGLYFWGKRIEESKTEQALRTEETPMSTTSNEAATIRSMSSSDEVTSLEADLKATNTTNLDKELR